MSATITYNTLPVDLIQRIKIYARSQRKHRTNLTSWPSVVVGMSGAIMLFDLEGDLFKELKAITDRIIPETKNLVMSATYNLASRYSYLPWHNDQNHSYAFTIYVNEQWDPEYAGLFLYQDGDKITALYPEFNKGVWFKSPLMHSTTMPNQHAPLRESIQLFWDATDEVSTGY